MKERILNKIKNQINVDYIDVINESHLHAGHIGAGADTHFRINIKSADFNKKTLIESHKMIKDILKDEFLNGLHALSIKIIK